MSEAVPSDLEALRQEHAKFLHRLAHELRTPLGSLLILAEILEDHSAGILGPRELDYVRKIGRAGGEMRDILHESVELAKLEAGEVETLALEVELAELVRDIEDGARPLAEELELELKTELGAGLPATLRTDRERLARLLGLLVSHTLRFARGETVTLHLTLPPGTVGRVSFRVGGGLAFGEEERRRAFEPFAQEKPKSGHRSLALPIARRLASLLGGELALTDAGGALELTLPLDRSSRGSLSRPERRG